MPDASSRVDILLSLTSKLEHGAEALDFLKNFASALTGIGLAFGAAELGRKVAELVKSSAELGAQLEIMANRAEMSTTAFQTLWITSERYGVKQEDLIRGSVTLQRNLEAAAKDGAGPMAKNFAALEVSAAGLQALAPERQFEVLGLRIATATDKHAAFAAAMEVLGAKTAPKLLEFLKTLGVEGYDNLADSVQKIRLSEAQIHTLESGAFHLERMATAAKLIMAAGLVNTMEAFSAALPPIVAAQQKMQELESKAAGANPFTRGLYILQLNHARAEFAREAMKVGDGGSLAQAGQTLDKMQAAGASGEVLEGLRAQLAAAYKRQEEIKAQHLETEQKMQAAELTAELAAMDKYHTKLAQKVEAFDQKGLNSAKAATLKGLADDDKKLDEIATKAKKAADPAFAIAERIKELSAAQAAGKLTTEEVAAAIEHARFEMEGGFTPAIEAARAKLLEFEQAANDVANNPFLSQSQRHQERIALLKRENVEIDHQIAGLQRLINLHPGVEGGRAARDVDGLQKRKVSNSKEIGAFDPAAGSVRQNLGADLAQMANTIKTPAQNIAGTITGTIGGAFDSLHQNVVGLLKETEDWHDALRNIVGTIEGDLISGIVKMFTQWIEQQAIAALLGQVSATTSTAIAAASMSAALITPATLSTIASFGASAAAAPVELAAAIATAAPLALFDVGGFSADVSPSSVAGLVHGGEWVAPNWMVEHPAFGAVIGGLESARTGGGSAGGATGRSGRPQRVIHTVAESPSHARQLFQDPNFDNEMLAWQRRHLGF